MAIFDYDNTINSITEFSLDFNEDVDYINEAGLGIEHTSGFYSLSTKLIALAKKIGGKVTKKKNYTSKSIKYQIERNEELRDKYYEELKLLKDNNYKIKPSMVAKWFFGLYICTTVTSAIGVYVSRFVTAPMVHSFHKKELINLGFGKMVDTQVINKVASIKTNQTITKAAISASKILAVINAISSAGMTAAVLADYKESLKCGIKQLDDNIKQLNDSYNKMVKIENSKNK